MSLTNSNTIKAKTDEDIIAEVNAKSYLTAACWKLDDNDTVTISDAFGNIPDITLGASPIWTNGYADFDGTTGSAYYQGDADDTELVELVQTKDLADSGMLIFNYWINSAAISPAATETLFSFGSGAGGDTNIGMTFTTTKVQFFYDDGTDKDFVEIEDSTMSNDTWHMVTVTIDATAINIYLDGSSAAVESHPNPVMNVYAPDNSLPARTFNFFTSAVSGSPINIFGSGTRTVTAARLMIIKSTADQTSNIAALIGGLYRKGVKGFAPELADL